MPPIEPPDGRAENYPAQLSGGQKQRVAIARALANDPEILISDESTSALDPKTTKQILSLLQDLNKKLGLTVVMITHEMQIVKDICNRVAVMQNGQLLEEGSVLDIFSNPQEDLTQEFIETAAGIEDALAKINAQPLVKNLPASALLVQLKYVGSSTDKPLLTEIFKDFGVSSNILYGNVEILGDTPVGELVVVLDGEADKVLAAQKAIENAGVSLQVLKKVKDAYPAHALAAPTVKHFHALGVPAFQNHGILQFLSSSVSSLYLRPMRRLEENTVFFGLVTA